MRMLQARRYVTPLREGGSLPAIVEADDGDLYVLKFRGAGQGQRALVAELLAGELARALGLPVPELALATLDAALARSEPDSEIQELMQASVGLNLAMRFLSGALAFDPLHDAPAADLASAIVWFDAATTNVDRTARNTNLLVWQGGLWLIDHGAALFVHHTWTDYLVRSESRFPQIKDHVLLPFASRLREADALLAPLLGEQVLREAVTLIPDEWLGDEPAFDSIAAHHEAYVAYLARRLTPPRAFVDEAIAAHERLA